MRLNLFCSKILSDAAGHILTSTGPEMMLISIWALSTAANEHFCPRVLLVIYLKSKILTILSEYYLVSSSPVDQSVQWQSKLGLYSTCTNAKMSHLCTSTSGFIYFSQYVHVYTKSKDKNKSSTVVLLYLIWQTSQ